MEKIKKFRLVLLSISGSFLLWLSWPVMPFPFLLFISFLPLLSMFDFVFEEKRRPGLRLFWASLLMFLLWNTATTYWIYFATLPGAIFAIVANALLMCIPISVAFFIRRKTNRRSGLTALVVCWMAFEYFHLNWQGSWPWLTLGNGFAGMPSFIQWYEYTGVPGGSLWFLLSNIFIYEWLRPLWTGEHRLKLIAIWKPALIILLPMGVSMLITPKDPVPDSSMNIVAVQPNIDPYFEKFDRETLTPQLEKLIALSEKAIDEKTVLVVWPETAIADLCMEDYFYQNQYALLAHEFVKRHPNIKLITGTTTRKIWDTKEKATATASVNKAHDLWYEDYNAAILMDGSESINAYHKSRLVPGVEGMPYIEYLGFLQGLIADVGGPSGFVGTQKEPSVFKVNNKIACAPVICYESVYGGYLTEYIRKGANIITIITNDGWWKNSQGYQQHFEYGIMRAIETRKMIVRCANTGISAFVLPSGKVINETKFWEPAVIKSPLYINQDNETFYTKHGDYLYLIASVSAFLFLLVSLILAVKAKFKG